MISLKFLILVRLALLAWITGVSLVMAQGIDKSTRVDIGFIGSISIPSNATLSMEPINMPDFSVYTVRRGAVTVLRIYLGNWPDFPTGPQPKLFTIQNCEARTVSYTADDLVSRDVLIEFREAPGFPQTVHFFYRALTPEVAVQADSIIESLRLSNPEACPSGNSK